MSCTPEGLSFAGVPLLQKTEAGFAPRSAPEIASLIKAAYGADRDPTRLVSSLGVIARALNDGDLARAAIAAVLTRTPELSAEAAARLAKADEKLIKYDPDQPRDWHGRWTKGGDAGPASRAKPADESASGRGADLKDPLAFTESDDAADDDESAGQNSPYPALERKYDWLGPVDFSKRVIQFGDRLGREGKNFSPAEKERALAEYSFLQDRLSFWLAYDYKPAMAQENLHSAALTLYQGAVNGGIVQAGHLPRSMLDVAGGVWAYDNLPQHLPRPRTKAIFENAPAAPVEAPREIDGLGGTVSNSKVNFTRQQGIKPQGDPLEVYIIGEYPDAVRLRSNSKTFDIYNTPAEEAISAKTMNTLSVSYIKNPQQIYWKIKRYVDAAADYEPRTDFDLDPGTIRSKTIHIAIPEYTSPRQLRYLSRGKRCGTERNVSVVITRIRE